MGKKEVNIDMSIIGETYNWLTVKEFAYTKNGKAFFICECKCGRKKPIAGTIVKNGKTKSCGKCGILLRVDLTDQIFGHLIARKRVPTPKGRSNKEYYWECDCDCGKTCTPTQRHLQNGDAKSCGCKRFDRSAFREHDPKMTNLIRVYEHYPDTDLAIEEFYDIIMQNCNYCNEPPSNKFNEHWNRTRFLKEDIEEANILYNGLDRIDPKGDHSRSNVVPCCFGCNVGKSDKTAREFVKQIIILYELFASKSTIIPNYTDLVKDAPEFRIEADPPKIFTQQYKPIIRITFGRLKVETSYNNETHDCVCSCKTKLLLTTDDLLSGKYRSCGCGGTGVDDIRRTCAIKDISRMTFGYLKVIGLDLSPRTNNEQVQWQCLCVCGEIKNQCAGMMKNGSIKSCGCLSKNREHTRKYNPFAANVMAAHRGYKDADILLKHFIILTQLNCLYCDAAPGNIENKDKNRITFTPEEREKYKFIYSGLDKIDQQGKHTLDNVVPCCKLHNRMKWVRSLTEFKEWIIAIYEHYIIGKLGYPDINWDMLN